jgi:hypothetical protein
MPEETIKVLHTDDHKPRNQISESLSKKEQNPCKKKNKKTGKGIKSNRNKLNHENRNGESNDKSNH